MSNLTNILYTPPQAAAILAIDVNTLTKWRWEGTGPAYHRIGGSRRGPIRYAPADLDAYVNLSRVEVL